MGRAARRWRKLELVTLHPDFYTEASGWSEIEYYTLYTVVILQS